MALFITFGVIGVIMTISVGLLMGLIFTSGMHDGIFKNILTLIIALIIGFGITGIMFMERDCEEKKWNNGICTHCNTEWHFQSATRSKSSTTYFYTCENGHTLKTEILFQKN